MSDYYTETSFTVPLGSEANVKEAINLWQSIENIYETEDYSDDYLGGFVLAIRDNEGIDYMPDMEYGPYCMDATHLHVTAGEYINVFLLACYVQLLLSHFELTEIVAIRYAATCSCPVPDAFQGGVYLVSCDQIRYDPQYEWIEKTTIEMQKAAKEYIQAKLKAKELKKKE